MELSTKQKYDKAEMLSAFLTNRGIDAISNAVDSNVPVIKDDDLSTIRKSGRIEKIIEDFQFLSREKLNKKIYNNYTVGEFLIAGFCTILVKANETVDGVIMTRTFQITKPFEEISDEECTLSSSDETKAME